MSNPDISNTVVWYRDEVLSCAQAAMEACFGRLVEVLATDDLADIPSKYRASARASFVPFRLESGRHAYRERGPDVNPDEFLTDYIHEMIGEHEFIIDTFQSKLVLLVSNNDDAWWEVGKDCTVEQQAFFAMCADVSGLVAAMRQMEGL